jgi:hypothetical protein
MKTFTGIKHSSNRHMHWKQHENTEKKQEHQNKMIKETGVE